MNTIPPLLRLAFLFLLAAGVAVAADSVPKSFSASIGDFFGPSYRVELKQGALTYTVIENFQSKPKTETIKPTPEQWRAFREALDAVKVWQWRGEYSNDNATDGTQWALEIDYAGQTLKTHGSNEYPGANGRPGGKLEATPEFKSYLQAVQKLLGGKSFE